MFTREQMIEAYMRGAIVFAAPGVLFSESEARFFAEEHVKDVDDGLGVPRIALEASTIEQKPSPYLPPNGTPEEVLARALASLMWRTHQAFTDPMTAHTWFTDAWYWPTMNSLRNAYPTLGALEDARVEA